MRKEMTTNVVLAVLLAALAFSFGCAGNLPPIDQDQVAYGICLATCKKGTCEKVEGVWACVPAPPRNCSEMTCPSEKPACAETQDGPTCYKPITPPPVEPPPVTPPPVTPPPVTPPPATGCGVEGDLIADFGASPATASAMREGIAAIGPRDGRDPAESLRLVGAWLNAHGFCTIVGIEAVFIKRVDGRFDEWHAVSFATGGWTNSGNGKFIGVHRTEGAAPPPVTDACPAAPCPERVWTAETLPPGWGEDAIGKPRWAWKAKEHTMGNADSTPVLSRDEPYCRAIGLSPYADGTPRGNCPVRPDGHPERVAVETWLLEGGAVRDSRAGQDCTPNNTDNPFAFLFGTGNCRICNTPRTVCSDWL